MKFFTALFAASVLGLIAPTGVLAEEEAADSSAMLKVPAAQPRPAEGEATPEATPAPAPEEPPIAEEDPSAEVPPAAEPGAGDDVVLAAFPLSRYEQLWERSPFQLESVAPPVESAGLAQRFALTGIAEINGEPIAFVMERATQRRLMLRKDSTEGDISLVQVDVQQKYNDSTATLRQGAEVGVVRFDAAAAVAGMPPPMPAMPQPGMPQMPQPTGVPPMAGIPPGQPRPPVPGQPMPGVVPPVPGPGVPQNGQVQADPGQMPPPRVIRRRAIIPAAP